MAEMNRLSRWLVNHVKGRANARLYRWLRAHLELPPASACLEIGCGNGNMAVRILDGMRPARLVATDVDPRQLEDAGRLVHDRYPAGGAPGLELRAADMLHLPFAAGEFDAVFAFASLHHSGATHRDPGRVGDALAEVDRVLRPNGQLAYEEFLHRQRIRDWLSAHGYRLLAEQRGWRREVVVAQKRPSPGGPVGEAPV